MLGHLFVIQDWPSVTGLIFFLQSTANYPGERTVFCYLIQYNKQSAGMLLTTIVLLWLLLGYFIKISLKKTGYFCHNYFCLSIKNLLVAPAKIKKLSKLTHGRLKNPKLCLRATPLILVLN